MNTNSENTDLGKLDDDHLRKTPYSVDPQYFEELEENLLLLSKGDPELGIPPQHGYEVGEGYFEGLQSRVMQNIRAEDGQSSRYSWAMSIAAVGVVLIGFSLFGIFSSPFEAGEDTQPTEVAQVEQEESAELLAYVEENYLDDLDIEEITALAYDEPVVEPVIEVEEDPEEGLDFELEVSDEELEEYLDEEFDIDDLIDEL